MGVFAVTSAKWTARRSSWAAAGGERRRVDVLELGGPAIAGPGREIIEGGVGESKERRSAVGFAVNAGERPCFKGGFVGGAEGDGDPLQRGKVPIGDRDQIALHVLQAVGDRAGEVLAEGFCNAGADGDRHRVADERFDDRLVAGGRFAIGGRDPGDDGGERARLPAGRGGRGRPGRGGRGGAVEGPPQATRRRARGSGRSSFMACTSLGGCCSACRADLRRKRRPPGHRCLFLQILGAQASVAAARGPSVSTGASAPRASPRPAVPVRRGRARRPGSAGDRGSSAREPRGKRRRF